jgi:acyl carrier protein
MAVAALPLTPSGKLDRQALPVPDETASATGRESVAPRGPLEGLLASIWAEVLGREEISVRDSFFDLGGNSLTATQVSILVQEVLPVELPLRKMFESPTIADIAALIEESAAGLSAEERQAMSEVLSEYSALTARHGDGALKTESVLYT